MLQIFAGTDTAYMPATKAMRQSIMLTHPTKWYGNAEILTMVTSTNAKLLGLSSLRNPYPWKLGAPKKVRLPTCCWSMAIQSMTSRLSPIRTKILSST
jgi:hypothetical protein